MSAEPETWRVLLVEDDEDDYLITRGMLPREPRVQFELEWCSSYDEALAVIREARHDVYLIDYRLGARDGLDLIQEALPEAGHPPVILLTGQGDHELDVRAAALGVTDYLVKQELSPGSLERSIRYAISRHRSEALAREAERDARVAAEAYRLLFDDNPQAMWVHDTANGHIFEANDAALAQYGYSRDELLSMRVSQLFPADGPSFASSAAWEREHPMAVTQRRADGTLIEAEVVSHVLEFRGRRGRLVMANDVTDRRRLERQLAASQRLESLGQLAGGVAHDFNNLLGVILNYAAFVAERINAEAGLDPSAWDSVRADMAQIEQAGRRASQLTKQLLAFARREAAHPDVISLGEVVAETERLLRRSLGEHVALKCHVENGLWHVRADAGQMQQVLVNLAVNARDAMPGGGTLRIEADNVEVRHAESNAISNGGGAHHVRLRVSDTGVGMDAATAARAFEPFYTTKPKGEGTGLGLATTYGIVTQAGGSISIDSAPGRGTTFTILLPASRESVSSPPAPLGELERGRGEVILLVEDQRSLLEVARRLLVRRGYDVLTATGGPAALELAAAHDGPIDLVLTDVVMPGMSGQEVARRLIAERPGICVAYMSGYAEPALDGAASISDGAVLIEKPFTEQSLVAGVARALADAAPPARTQAFHA